ncbi:MAG: hypothetical protein H6Q31_417 [Bacteroidetes bacterium]|jgi:hypothetical protein|nr:hypothetical protein [Bacteroidota bacterium]
MSGSKLFLTTCAAIVLIAAAHTSQSYAQVRGDVRVGFFTNGSNVSLGAGIIGGIAPNLYLNPMIEYVFVSEGTSLFLSGDGHYDFPIRNDAHVWLGGGLGVQYVKVNSFSDTNVGLNLLTGAALGMRESVYPYIQLKGFLSKTTTAQLAIGLRF